MGTKTLNFLKNKDAARIETTSIAVKPKEKTEKTTTKKANKNLKVKMYDDGLWRVLYDEQKENFVQLEQLSSAIKIVAMAKTEKGENWSALLEWLDSQKNLHSWAMPMEILTKNGNPWLETLMNQGFWVLPEAISDIKTFLAGAHKSTTKFARLATKTGWSEDLKTFALPHTNLGGEEEELVVMQQTPGTSKMYKSSGTLEDWKREVAEKSVGNSRLSFIQGK